MSTRTFTGHCDLDDTASERLNAIEMYSAMVILAHRLTPCQKNSLKNKMSMQSAPKSRKSQSKVSTSPSNPGLVTSDNIESSRPIMSYKDEMVASFFTAMLVHVIDKKEVVEEPATEVSSVLTEPGIIAKDFKDLLDNDLIQQEVVSVEGSQVSLGNKTKKMGQKRSSILATKRGSQTQGSIKSGGSLKKRKHVKSTSSTLPIISESESTKNLNDQEMMIESWRVPDSSEYVTITFRNSNAYKGPLRNHLFHGEGTFFWNDGTIYFGHFEDGEINGFGRMIYADMSIYHGYFFHGKPHGMGAFYKAYCRTLYNGNWVHGKKEGKGWLHYSEHNWYEGEWHDDCRGGFGTRQYPNGSKYTGNWKDGVRHGHGACAFANGDFYKGEWHNGELHGYGEYTWKAFFNKSLTFPVENLYQGGWINGMRDGFGHMYFGLEHGARLVGFWSMNFKHGMGIVIDSNGDVIERNPLFFNDKPVHLSIFDDDNVSGSRKTQGVCMHPKLLLKKQQQQSYNLLPEVSQGWLLRTPANETSHTTISTMLTELNVQSSIMQGDMSIHSDKRPSLYTKRKGNSTSEQMSNIQKIDRLQDFPAERLMCNPLIINIRSAPETLNLNFYVNMYLDEAKMQIQARSLASSLDWQSDSGQMDSDDASIWKETNEHEMNNLRNVIWHNTKDLQRVYEIYANISKDPTDTHRKCTLLRLYLWQMYRDFQIHKHGLSLYETDKILLENPFNCLETDHGPFERIYYWQFLWSLIGVAWRIHIDKKNKLEPYQLQSVYIVFEDFLKQTVYPFAGIHIGPCLFEFKDLLPITDVVALYENVGPLLTARQFLNKCCCIKRTDPLGYLQNFGDNSIIQPEYGINTIAVGRNFVYLPATVSPRLNSVYPRVAPRYRDTSGDNHSSVESPLG